MTGAVQKSAPGPVQVLLIGIETRGSEGMLAAEVQDMRTYEEIRVLDALRVRRAADGSIGRLDPLVREELPGTVVEALMVADPDGPRGRPAPGSESGAECHLWSLADRIPRGSAAMILLIEHRWAIPLREAAIEYEAGIFGDAWIHPLDLDAALLQAGKHEIA